MTFADLEPLLLNEKWVRDKHLSEANVLAHTHTQAHGFVPLVLLGIDFSIQISE